jgi:hypothetical protein
MSDHSTCSFTFVHPVKIKQVSRDEYYRKPRFGLEQSCLKFQRFQVRRSVRRAVIPTEVSHGFLQSLQASAERLIKSSRQTHPSTFLEFVSHWSSLQPMPYHVTKWNLRQINRDNKKTGDRALTMFNNKMFISLYSSPRRALNIRFTLYTVAASYH